ncbi:DUF4411 family protein [Chryseobacterium zhengzhouense]|uniref:DUF4411 family protein n=1 Tax=Chryseobacterium zhengzhouense TaxID=1636086 RepID=A0ABW2M5N4_9FLAO
MAKYLLDSNIFIQAHRMYYPFDVVPSFWNKILELSNNGIIISIDKVKKELCETNNPDQLSSWCENELDNSFFVDSTSCVDIYAQIAIWTHSSTHFLQSAKDEFLTTDLADPWLIAYAKKHNLTIVTHEISQPQRKNRIKIPEPCIHFGVRYLSPIEMFREIGESF